MKVKMMNKKITYLGKIVNVNSGKVDVTISRDVPSSTPIIEGVQYKIGQIGTLVKIPLGNSVLYGVVDSVSISGINIDDDTIIDEENITRIIKVSLIGEKIGKGKFQKGVGTFPTINDEVHIVTDKDLKMIYDFDSTGQIELGRHASSTDLPIYLDLQKNSVKTFSDPRLNWEWKVKYNCKSDL